MATDLIIRKGKTFSRVLRWAAAPYIYKAITAIAQTAPATITSTAHGIPDGWRVAVVSVKGMTQINSEKSPPSGKDWHKATSVDANTVAINDINAADFSAYTSGGYLQFLTPVDMAGYTARMSIKDVLGGTELLRLDTTNSRIVIDNTLKKITLTVDAATTAVITWTDGVYDLEMVSGTDVYLLLSGAVTVEDEVTTA
jgi:hypothetical protein